jgi:polygalacturonase
LDSAAIQAAIDECSSAGGGTVYFPAGTYLSGTILLKDHVSLYMEAGATLLGSTDLDDYPVMISNYRSYTDNYTERSLIYAERVENISILGRGAIDGQGAAFKDRTTRENPYKLRPYIIRVIECKDVTVRDITIRNSPMWVQHYLACDDVLIDGITVDSNVAGNNDGIDIDSCQRVRISNCDVYSGDDALVLKATSNRPCRDVTVTNCNLSSDCNAFKLGTESNGGFQNISLSNCTIHDTRLAGIALEMVDGGTLERVNVNNVVIQNCGAAIFMRLGNRARPYLSKGPGGSRGTWRREPGLVRPGMGLFREVIISNVQAVGIDNVGCSITGIPGHPIEDVLLENISIRFEGGGTADLVKREVPENEEGYPEYRMFGPLPSYGFFVRHVEDIHFENVELEYEKPDARPAFLFDDVTNLALTHADGMIENQAPAFIVMKGVAHAMVTNCQPTRPMDAFIQAENSHTISILNNVFTRVRQVIRLGDGMDKGTVFEANNRK